MIEILLEKNSVAAFVEALALATSVDLNDKSHCDGLKKLYTKQLSAAAQNLLQRLLTPEKYNEIGMLIHGGAISDAQKKILEEIPTITHKTRELLDNFRGYYL